MYSTGPPEHELQPVRQVIQARMLFCNFQGLTIDIQANCSRHTHLQCQQRQNARSGPNIEDGAGNLEGNGFFESLTAECRRWMMSGSKGCGIGQSERVG